MTISHSERYTQPWESSIVSPPSTGINSDKIDSRCSVETAIRCTVHGIHFLFSGGTGYLNESCEIT